MGFSSAIFALGKINEKALYFRFVSIDRNPILPIIRSMHHFRIFFFKITSLDIVVLPSMRKRGMPDIMQ